MNRYLCISCWRVSQPNELLYRCPDCAATEPSRDYVEPWLIDPNQTQEADNLFRPVSRRKTSLLAQFFTDEDDPSVKGSLCSHHPGIQVHLHCQCRAPVVPRSGIVRGEPLTLGIAGPRNAGKTLLLLAMVHQLRKLGSAAAGFGLFGVGDTESRFGELSTSLFRDGDKPNATSEDVPDGKYGDYETALDAIPQSFCWQVLDPGERRVPSRLLAVYDLAGETWGNERSDDKLRFQRYMQLLASVIFVVDGAELARDLGIRVEDAWDIEPSPREDRGATDRQWLSRVVDRMGDRSRRSNLALVITKADLLWNTPDWKAIRPGSLDADSDAAAQDGLQDQREALLERLLISAHRSDLILASEKHFREVRLFATSSLGFRPGPEDLDEQRLGRSPEPTGVLAPLRWLLADELVGARA